MALTFFFSWYRRRYKSPPSREERFPGDALPENRDSSLKSTSKERSPRSKTPRTNRRRRRRRRREPPHQDAKRSGSQLRPTKWIKRAAAAKHNAGKPNFSSPRRPAKTENLKKRNKTKRPSQSDRSRLHTSPGCAIPWCICVELLRQTSRRRVTQPHCRASRWLRFVEALLKSSLAFCRLPRSSLFVACPPAHRTKTASPFHCGRRMGALNRPSCRISAALRLVEFATRFVTSGLMCNLRYVGATMAV